MGWIKHSVFWQAVGIVWLICAGALGLAAIGAGIANLTPAEPTNITKHCDPESWTHDEC